METYFLNLHDHEEHFGTALYQNELLDDSRSSILDIVGDSYTRRDSDDYIDHSVIWEQDVERELNGDVAVIPMSSRIDSLSKLSNSPPSKDFQRFFNDWQHFAAVEIAPHEDLTTDFHVPNQGFAVDMLDNLTTPSLLTQPADSFSLEAKKLNPVVPNFDFSNTVIPDTKPPFETETKFKIESNDQETVANSVHLIKKEKVESDSDVNSSDELDIINDHFDLTSYVNGDDDLFVKKECELNETQDLKKTENKQQVSEPVKSEVKILHEDSEEDCIDVETVTDQIPVLQARDLRSLLEQFEASEAVNPKASINQEVLLENKVVNVEPKKCTTKTKVKVEPKAKNVDMSLPVDLINKLKASGVKKSISVIPAMPSRKLRINKLDSNRHKSSVKLIQNRTESVHLDHDYCMCASFENSAPKSANESFSQNLEDLGTSKIIDDTAIRIGKQIKNAINNENAFKQKSKSQPMVSLLKTNRNPSMTTSTKISPSTIVKAINTSAEQKQNIIVKTEDDTIKVCKKRKLNLEEYKRLRGDIIKISSTDSSLNTSPTESACNSPAPASIGKENYQELITKMASEILKTNAKSKSAPETLSNKFTLPDTPPAVVEQVKTPPKQTTDSYEMKTIVSIGVNTDDSFLRKSKTKLKTIIKPILQIVNSKINSNSLIANITETLLQQQTPKSVSKIDNLLKSEVLEPVEHGEDKTVIILQKNVEKPLMNTISIQTEEIDDDNDCTKEKKSRHYRTRRDSSASSTTSVSSIRSKSSTSKRMSSSQRSSHRTSSSSNSVSSSLGSRMSRSRSRSSSSSSSVYSDDSYSSSSRSKSRSLSPSRRWHPEKISKSRHRYMRSRRRSRSIGHRDSYNRSRSPYNRNHSKVRRDSVERIREVEERRVIYVGKIEDKLTKAELRRRFQSFGPITNVSVHFRDRGDNYGFVTFAYKEDAYEVLEHGNDEPSLSKYDISFGGRREFCKMKYSDLDKVNLENGNSAQIFRREDSFDILLREFQAKMRNRKV